MLFEQKNNLDHMVAATQTNFKQNFKSFMDRLQKNKRQSVFLILSKEV